MIKKSILAIAFAFQSVAFAGPTEAVSTTIGKMLDILRSGNERAKISQLCTLVRTDVDTATIGIQLLGNFARIHEDAEGVNRFKAIVPSIIMDQFYGLLHDKGGARYTILGTVPKGSARVGVKTNVAGTVFVITVLRSNNKIVDVEWNNYSLVNTKRDEFQRDLASFHTNKPVSALVDRMNHQGVNKCR